MFSFIGKLFGSDTSVKNSISLIDNAFYTDQEKAASKIKLLQAYQPFKLAQRIIAIAVTAQFLVFCNAGLIQWARGKEYDSLITLSQALGFDTAVSLVFFFYFGGGAVAGIMRAKNNKE